MISKIAWENILWLKNNFFNDLKHIGGSMISIDPFRPMLKRSWIKRLRPAVARRQFFQEIKNCAAIMKKSQLTTSWKMSHWENEAQVAIGGKDYSKVIEFMHRAHFNLYCLSTHRKTIEELSVGAYKYVAPEKNRTSNTDSLAIADLRRLLRLNNVFLLAEWVHDMIERAIANKDEKFFKTLSNSIKQKELNNPSAHALNWLLVLLLWFLGGKAYRSRREFLHNLHLNNIISEDIDEYTFNAELTRLGLTKI